MPVHPFLIDVKTAGITGLVLSLIGRRKISNDPRFKGKGRALAGLICGIVACGLFAIALLSAV